MKTLVLSLSLVVLLILNPFKISAQQDYPEKFLVKVYLDGEQAIEKFRKMEFDLATQKINKYAEVVVGPEELMLLAELGYQTEIIPDFNSNPEVIAYPSYEEVSAKLVALAAAHPDIMHLSTLGYSQRQHLAIPLVKVSDNVMDEEDEPAILFDGQHHAREPVGMLCTLVMLEYLLNNYGLNYQVTDWVDNTEIFFIPMLNVEGWKYLYDNNLGNPWWRKNMRENNGNTIFQPSVDGVDLNRNYKFNFLFGGSANINSWTYRGPFGFSESETRAKRDLTLEQKFVASITYHSYGEIILFPWNESPLPGDFNLLEEIAGDMARLIPALDMVNSYEPVRSGCQVGQSPCWMYGVGGVLEVLVETGEVFIPTRETGDKIAWDNLQSALYLLNRVQGPGIKGIISDAVTGDPIEAILSIKELDNGASTPRSSNQAFGRYYRLLQTGTYTVEASLEGYHTQTVSDVTVSPGLLQELNIQLEPKTTFSEEISFGASGNQNEPLSIYPNPFVSQTHIALRTKTSGQYQLRIYNQFGQLINILLDEYLPRGINELIWDGHGQNGQELPKGLYIISLSGPDKLWTGKILKR